MKILLVEESIVNAPVCRVKTQTTQKVRLDLNNCRGALTIDSSTPTWTGNLNEQSIRNTLIFLSPKK
jgi:hypothetical protein